MRTHYYLYVNGRCISDSENKEDLMDMHRSTPESIICEGIEYICEGIEYEKVSIAAEHVFPTDYETDRYGNVYGADHHTKERELFKNTVDYAWRNRWDSGYLRSKFG